MRRNQTRKVGKKEFSPHLKVFPARTDDKKERGGNLRLFYTTCPLCVTVEEEEKEEGDGATEGRKRKEV